MKIIFLIILILSGTSSFSQEENRSRGGRNIPSEYFDYRSLPIVIDRISAFSDIESNRFYSVFNFDEQFDKWFSNRVVINDTLLFVTNSVSKVTVKDKNNQLVYELYYDRSGRKTKAVNYIFAFSGTMKNEIFYQWSNGILIADSTNYYENNKIQKILTITYTIRHLQLRDTLVTYSVNETTTFRLGSYINKRNKKLNEYNAHTMFKDTLKASDSETFRVDYAEDDYYLTSIKNEYTDYQIKIIHSDKRVTSNNIYAGIYTATQQAPFETKYVDGEYQSLLFTRNAASFCGTSAMQHYDMIDNAMKTKYEVKQNDKGLPASYLVVYPKEKLELYAISYEHF